MLRRITSAISLDTIDPDAELYRSGWGDDAPSLGLTVRHGTAGNVASLCDRCQNFNIQSFAQGMTRRKGYLLKEVEDSAETGCDFCALLLDAVKDIEKPEYFFTNAFAPGRTVTNPDLYIHMTASESYKSDLPGSGSLGLRANRLFIELGDRFSGLRKISTHEICLAADPCM